ncbi:MAG TPA: homoserine kinase [Candidatus Humimicrobiaceae bacterium]
MDKKNLLTRVRTYATSANLGPGFDCAGLALDIYNDCEVYENNSKNSCFSIKGLENQGIAKGENNLILRTIKKALQKKYGQLYAKYQKPVEIVCEIKVPVERGLGSSSTAVVAGLLIANKLYELDFNLTELLNIGLEIEPHPDNIAPCLSGGLAISYKSRSGSYCFEKISIMENFRIMLMIPDYRVNTNAARKLVPEFISKEDAILNIANFAMLINRLKDGNLENAVDFIRDRIHQPYRKDVYPDSMEIVEELNNRFGMLAAISGSGPTVLAFVPEKKFEEFNSSIVLELQNKYCRFKLQFTSINNSGSCSY